MNAINPLSIHPWSHAHSLSHNLSNSALLDSSLSPPFTKGWFFSFLSSFSFLLYVFQHRGTSQQKPFAHTSVNMHVWPIRSTNNQSVQSPMLVSPPLSRHCFILQPIFLIHDTNTPSWHLYYMMMVRLQSWMCFVRLKQTTQVFHNFSLYN